MPLEVVKCVADMVLLLKRMFKNISLTSAFITPVRAADYLFFSIALPSFRHRAAALFGSYALYVYVYII